LLRRAQGYSSRARHYIESGSRRAVEPVIHTRAAASRWQTRLGRLARGRRARSTPREYRL
jgi:hypothetical protein